MDSKTKRFNKITKNLLWAGGVLVLLTLINYSILAFTDVTSRHYSESYTSDWTVEYEIPTPFGVYSAGSYTEISPSCSICLSFTLKQKPFSGFLLGGFGFYKFIEFHDNSQQMHY